MNYFDENKQIVKDSTTNLVDYFFDDILDPHVRIVGRKEDVLRVKDKIMAVLDAKVSKYASFKVIS